MKLKKRIAHLSHLKVRYKLILTYALVVVVPVLIVGLYLNYTIRQIIIDQAMQETTTNMNHIEERLDSIFSRVVRISDILTLDEDVLYLATYPFSNLSAVFVERDRALILNELTHMHTEISHIRFYHFNPKMLQVGNFSPVTDDVRETMWFQLAMERNGGIDWTIKTENNSGNDYLILTRLIKHPTHGDLGVLNIYINSEALNDVFSNSPYESIILFNYESLILQNNELFTSSTLMYTLQEMYDGEIAYIPRHLVVNEGEFEFNIRSIDLPRVERHMQIITVIPVEVVTARINSVMIDFFFVISGSVFFTVVLIFIFTKTFNRRLNKLKSAMNQVATGDFDLKPPIKSGDEVDDIYLQLYETMNQIEKLIQEVYVQKVNNERLKVKQKESEFKRLASQINPHFLYNTLEMIRVNAKRMSDGDEVETAVKLLSKLLRNSLENHDQLVTIARELEFTKMYLEIQKLRFKDKIQYEFDVELTQLETQIMPFLIQPLVENSFIHGIELKEGEGNIQIVIGEMDHLLVIEIIDNGIGITKERMAQIEQMLANASREDDMYEMSTSLGLVNVEQRVKLFYGDDYGMKIESEEGKGTKVRLILPLECLNSV